MVRRLPVFIAVLALAMILAPAALATTPFMDITSSGPLTDIAIGNDLGCQVAYSGDTDFEFYPDSQPGDCGTLFSTGGTLYAPDFANHAGGTATGNLGSYTPFSPISQPAVTGAGTSSSPYQLTTTVGVGTTGLSITEVDSYVVGAENYRNDVTISNSGGSAVQGLLYRAGDCYLQNSDAGYGYVDTSINAPACTQNANNSPSGRIEEFAPITGGANYVESYYSTVWADIGAHTDLPNACDCTNFEDNGAGINWDVTVPANGSVTYSSLDVFSPVGALALSTSKTADVGTAKPGASDGYTITVTNPNLAAVNLTDITDTLPAGFTYTAGSSSGATTTDPSVSGQNLTWTGPFTVPGGGTLTLHFNVAVSSTPGTYMNNAGADSTSYSVTPTGPTAQVIVIGPPSATITTPANNATYTQGQVVDASYSCAEATSGPGLKSSGGCVGTVSNGSPIDTSSTGPHTFTVTAYSQDGQSYTATSNYTVTPSSTPGNALKFATQPNNARVGQTITGTAYTPTGPPVTVDVVDAMGNIVTSSTAPVTLALQNNPGSAMLGGTTTVNAVAGVATFHNLTVNKPGLGYTLTATSPTLTSATSSAFDVNTVAVTCKENVNCTGTVSNSSIKASVTAGFNPNAPDAGVLTVSLNLGPELKCPNYTPQGSGWIYFNATATTRTKTIVYTIMNPKGKPLSVFQLCYGAPYQFKTQSGAPATRTVWSTGTVEYVGLLPNCPTRGTITGPCLKSRVAHSRPASVILTAFVPAGLPGDPRVHG